MLSQDARKFYVFVFSYSFLHSRYTCRSYVLYYFLCDFNKSIALVLFRKDEYHENPY